MKRSSKVLTPLGSNASQGAEFLGGYLPDNSLIGRQVVILR